MKDNKDLALANQIHDKITQISSMESDSPEILKQTLDVMDQKQQANNKVKLNRYSDYGIYACENLHPRTWRVLSFIVNQLSLYPYEAVAENEDGTLLERYIEGRQTFSAKYRRCTILSSAYGELHCPASVHNGGAMLLRDLLQFKQDAIRNIFSTAMSSDDSTITLAHVESDVSLWNSIEVFRKIMECVSRVFVDMTMRCQSIA